MATDDLTCERLQSAFHYDVETGLFTRISCADRSHIGDLMSGLDDWGYIRFRVFGRKYRAHRLAWLYVFGEWPRQQLDHIDGDKRNNRIGNLRDVPQEINQQNRHVATTANRSGLLGVHINGNGFNSEIRTNGVREYLGWFDAPEKAHAAYLSAKAKKHPEAFS